MLPRLTFEAHPVRSATQPSSSCDSRLSALPSHRRDRNYSRCCCCCCCRVRSPSDVSTGRASLKTDICRGECPLGARSPYCCLPFFRCALFRPTPNLIYPPHATVYHPCVIHFCHGTQGKSEQPSIMDKSDEESSDKSLWPNRPDPHLFGKDEGRRYKHRPFVRRPH